ncbi:hypothetical protein [Arthrobacter sp. HY1533]|uniref:hypothetical protein n=1 Tax=Arthrobacter sp. HY1533 TaxID=2970919 RepID=UPI0022BA00B3|nr:hypothetical protein [Arthrobacter sp. HY1533]
MTTFRTSAYEGTNSFAITAAAQGGTSVFTGSGGSAVYAAGAKADAACGKFTGQSSLITAATYSATTLYWRGYFKAGSAPDSNRMIVDWRNAAAVTLVSLGVDTTSKWRLRNTSGTTTATSVTVFTANVWYGILYTYNTATGAQSARFYDPDGEFLEEIIGTGTAGTIVEQREGVLQGASTWFCYFDDTSTADTVLMLTGVQVDPDQQGPTDPYRTSPYDGLAGSPLQREDGNGYYSAFDGSGSYAPNGFASSTICGRFVGQYALRTQRGSFGAIVYWKGWIRPSAWPDTNRLVLELQTPAAVSQAAVGLDDAGHWRLRAVDGVTTAVSNRRITPGQWYGCLWTVNRTTGVQELKIYSYFGSLLETVTGTCGTAVTGIHLEGCTQGRPTWYVDFDDTVLHRVAQTITTPLTEVPSNLRFRDGKAVSAPQVEALYWDGTTLAPLEIVESL